MSQACAILVRMLDSASEAIGARVRGIAAESGRSQQAVADILGIDRKSVGARMQGKVAFTGPELLLLSQAWDVPISRFYPERAA